MAYSVDEAETLLEGVVRSLPPHATFTSASIFEHIPLSCDKRARGGILRRLCLKGFIKVKEITTRDQEERHNGLAVLWEVKRMNDKQETPVTYQIGDHYKTGSSKKRNELIHSGEWKEVLLTKDGWYTLEKVR